MTQITQKSFLLPVILWIAAFICALNPINEFQLEFIAGAVMLSFVWAFAMLSRNIESGWSMPRRSPVLLLAGLFWALVICSAFWSEIKPMSLTAMCFFSLMPLTFFVGVMGASDLYFKKIVKCLAVIFAVLAVWAVFQFFFLNAYFGGQARHPLADPSSLGALLSLGLFCALGGIVSDCTRKQRRIATAFAILLLFGIMSTVSRGPIFAFVPALVVFIPLLWPKIKQHYKPLLLVILAALAFEGVMATNVQKRLDLAHRLFGTLTSPDNGGSVEMRPEVWKATLHMIEDRPLFGYGIGTYFLYYPEYRLQTEKDGVYYAHNDPLQFWMELGILGPLLFYGFAIAAAVRTFRALKKLPPDDPERVKIVSLFTALVAMVAQSHVGFNHYNPTILMVSGLMLSIWFFLTAKALKEEQQIYAMPDNMPHNLNKALLALPFLMMGWLYLSIMGGEYFVNKARDALFKQDMQAFMENINNAGNVSLGLNYRAYLFAVNVPMTILEDRKSTLNEGQQKDLFVQVQGYMDQLQALNPRASSPYYYMAKVQSLVAPSVIPEDMATPEELYERALTLDPMHLGARMELLKVYQEQGRSVADQIALLESGYNFVYNTLQAAEYYDRLARLYLEVKNYGKVKEVLSNKQAFEKRSKFSLERQNMSIPQAVMGGNDALYTP